MKNYTVITKEIKDYKHGKNKNTDIYLFSYLKLCSNHKTGRSNATQKKISELTKISLRTIQSSVSRLRTSDLLSVETKNKGFKRMNIYIFKKNPKNYFFVDNTFFYTDITVKEKGLLLLIKSLCLNNTNKTLYSSSKISNEIDQNPKTVKKYIDSLIAKNMLLKLEKGYQLPANYFPLYFGNEYEDFIYDSILKFCQLKKTILFTPNSIPLNLIFSRYPFKQEDFRNTEEDDLNRFYLPRILEERCPSLPSKINSLNYFLDVLNIEYIKSEKEFAIIL